VPARYFCTTLLVGTVYSLDHLDNGYYGRPVYTVAFQPASTPLFSVQQKDTGYL
jgi:hypothetical protein